VEVRYVCAGVAVARYERAVEWYERFFGRPPDVLPRAGEAMWVLEGTDGTVYIVEDGERAGRSLAAVLVGDLDTTVAGLLDRGIPAAEVRDAVPRRVIVTDPDGNRITVGEAPS
jgi:catechol 2,3-dioxygenase-like lactoylglutathione lyase family enzyme